MILRRVQDETADLFLILRIYCAKKFSGGCAAQMDCDADVFPYYVPYRNCNVM